MVKFYLQLERPEPVFRLQSDKRTWRSVGPGSPLESGDYLSEDRNEVIRLQKKGDVEIGGKHWVLNPESGRMGDPTHLYYTVYAKRSIFPPIPEKDQLTTVIAAGNDEINNSLILNIDGLFELRNFRDLLNIDDPTIVFRNETFAAGNDYVGLDASRDKSLVNSIYTVALNHWLIHLQTGKTNLYGDMGFGESASTTLAAIENLKSKF